MKMIVQADEQTDTPGLSRAKERVLNLNRSASRIVLAGLVLGFIFCMVAIPYFVRVSRRTPVVESMSPSRNELGVATNAPVRLTFNNKMRAGTINPSTFELRDDKDQIVPAQVEYRVSTRPEFDACDSHAGWAYVRGQSFGWGGRDEGQALVIRFLPACSGVSLPEFQRRQIGLPDLAARSCSSRAKRTTSPNIMRRYCGMKG